MTSCPGRHGPGYEELWGRPSIPDHSIPGPSLRGDDQLCRPTRPRVQGAVGSASYPGPISPMSELTRSGPSLPSYSDLGPRNCWVEQLYRPSRSRVRADVGSTRSAGRLRPSPSSSGVNQLSRPSWSQVRGDAGSTSYSGPLGPGSELKRGRSTVPAVSDPGPRSSEVDQLFWPTRPRFELTRGQNLSRRSRSRV